MSNLIEVQRLKKHFQLGHGLFGGEKGVVHAVDGANFVIEKGKTLGLVGESGCGKTTIGRLLLRLEEPTDGMVLFLGKNIFSLEKKQMKEMRREMQIIFQDSTSSLNPRQTIKEILSRPYIIHKTAEREEIENKVEELLAVVGLTPTQTFIDRYPHELSGGQKQRVAVAKAIAVNPAFIVADEPVSSLDISIRAQILKLLQTLQARYEMAYLFITHDLSVVRSICHSVAIMYLGKIVELAEVDELFSSPLHPYTKSLLLATPIPNPRKARARQRQILGGEVPSPVNPPSGCRFHPRCPSATEICREKEPPIVEDRPRHYVACHS